MESVHVAFGYNCRVCGRKFVVDNPLKNCKESVYVAFGYKCWICGRKFLKLSIPNHGQNLREIRVKKLLSPRYLVTFIFFWYWKLLFVLTVKKISSSTILSKVIWNLFMSTSAISVGFVEESWLTTLL